MQNKIQSQTLAETYESVRNLTRFYISKLGNLDVFESIEYKGKKFNSPYWLIGHLVWSEHSLIIEGLGGKSMDIPWLEKFELGVKPTETDKNPAFDEILQNMEKVHAYAMELIRSLSDNELDQPNLIEAVFGGKNTKRAVIMHAIRHEPMHLGQLTWILKTHNIELI
jgi:uncharacterized damage-inducible protein DinB